MLLLHSHQEMVNLEILLFYINFSVYSQCKFQFLSIMLICFVLENACN